MILIYFLRHCYFFLFRITSNFEYCENEFVTQHDVLEAASKCSHSLNATSLGNLIRDVWEGKVKRVRHGFNNTRYSNLRKRSTDGLHRSDDAIENLTEETIHDIRSLCANRSNWLIDLSLSHKKILTLMRSPNFDGKEV